MLPYLRTYIFLALSINVVISIGQVKNIGVPDIINYPKTVYQAGTQNWAISQDQNGFMYFANNEGVLIFNGLQWKQIRISEAKPVRSIFTDKENNVYVGVLNDFGLLSMNKNGSLGYKSLRYVLPNDIQDFDEIWRIYEIPEGIVFQTFEYIFLLKDDKVIVLEPEKRFHFSFCANDRLFVQEPGIGIFEYHEGKLEKLSWSDEFQDKIISEILFVREDHLLICTRDHGIYELDKGVFRPWQANVNHWGEKNKIYSAARISGNNYAFGSILNGLLISDNNGNLLQHLNQKNGLQNNTILSLYTGNCGNLWIGLDNGISYVELNPPITYLTRYIGLGTGYCARIFKNNIYLGTNQGLYVKSINGSILSEENYELVENTTGQVWCLDVIDDQLICGHNSGTFIVEDRKARKISSEEGGWTYIQLKDHPEYLLGGHYNGLVLFEKTPEGWRYKSKIPGFNESCRFLLEDNDGAIWMSHGAKGIYRIRINNKLDSVDQVVLYTSDNGLPSDENNIVFELFDEIIISTINGIYKYYEEKNSFEPYSEINELLKIEGRLKALVESNENDIWFIGENESGVLRLNEDNTYTKITAPLKQLDNQYVNEFEFIYPYDNENVFIAIDDGFAHYSSSVSKSYSLPLKSIITEVELPYLDSVINYTYLINDDREYKFPFMRNSFRFHFTSPFFENPEQIYFSFYLEEYSQEWSPWSDVSFKDFTNLREGSYTFKVKAKNIYDNISDVASFDFTILPPWHRSRTAYYLYIVFSVFALFIIFRIIQHRINKSKSQQLEEHQMELKNRQEQYDLKTVMAEKEIVRLRNEKLRSDMTHRNKELANQTMSIIQKNKVLSELKDTLTKLKQSISDSEAKQTISDIRRKIDKELDNKHQNKVFKTYFDEVHKDFLERLRMKFPNLSPRELHLCAYIRMNLSTKEIAALLNISDRGVEISRYRLRKKLELSRQENLSVFLSNI